MTTPERNSVQHGDNLEIMRGWEASCVDLVYADGPYNTGRNFSFKDKWTKDDYDPDHAAELIEYAPAAESVLHAARDCAGVDMWAFLCVMCVRYIHCHRLLRDTGNMWVQCDPTASHYLKMLLDAIFGRRNFRNEVVWCYSNSGRSRKKFCAKHDTLLWYSKSGNYTWPGFKVPIENEATLKLYSHTDGAGRQVRNRTEGGRNYTYYLDEGIYCNDWWADLPPLGASSGKRLDYDTQKPLPLLKRIIEASSNPGDLILDPYCGSGTSLEAAALLGRDYVGIDSAEDAVSKSRARLDLILTPTSRPVARAG